MHAGVRSTNSDGCRPGGVVLTDRGLSNLRRAATLAHRYPTLRIQVGVGATTLVEVSAQPDLVAEGVTGVSPCAFRAAVVAAWQRHRAGDAIRLLQLPADPVVELRPVLGGAHLPGGIVRTPLVDHFSYLLATSLCLPEFSDAAKSALDAITTIPQVGPIGWFRDPDTEIALIHVDVAPTFGDDEGELVALLQDLAAALLAAELLADVSGGIRVGDSGST